MLCETIKDVLDYIKDINKFKIVNKNYIGEIIRKNNNFALINIHNNKYKQDVVYNINQIVNWDVRVTIFN